VSTLLKLRFALGQLIVVCSVLGIAAYDCFVLRSTPDNWTVYAVIGLTVPTLYIFSIRHLCRYYGTNGRTDDGVTSGAVLALILMLSFFTVPIAVDIIFDPESFFMKRQFGAQVIDKSIFDGTVITAGETSEVSSNSKICFLGGHYAQKGDGNAVVLHRSDEKQPQFPDVILAKWTVYAGLWWDTIKGGSCTTGKLSAEIEFPLTTTILTKLTIELRMPTLYPRSIDANFFENTTETLSTQPIDVVLLPHGSSASEQFSFRKRVENIPWVIGFILFLVWSISLILMFVGWGARL